MTTIYNECLLLKNNNNVIDLTEKKMYNTPCINKFEYDINIIKNAKCNIGVGHGGQFCFNICFSNNTLYYCPKGLINFNIKKEKFKIYNNLDNFKNDIIKNYC